MKNEIRTANMKTPAADELLASTPGNDKSERAFPSTRQSSRKRQVSPSESNSEDAIVGSAKLASNNESVKPGTDERSSQQVSRKRVRSAKTERAKSSGKKVGKASSIDAVASLLAALDERAYRRALLRDANCINHSLLTPMSLPWMHAVVPVARNIPCDIDEMPEILTSDDGAYTAYENGPFGFGNFAMGKMRPATQSRQVNNEVGASRSAARRSEDPGVIELSTIVLPSNEREGTTCNSSDDFPVDLSISGDYILGEMSLKCFEVEQQLKERRVEQARSLVRKQFISVNINSTSSKSRILPANVGMGSLLEAKMPAEVQEGRFLTSKKAKPIAEKLGTYDLRHGLSPTNPSGKNANRVSVGRTRRMWTSKIASDQPQSVSFASLLTGTILESGTQRRPRDIKVGIKVNGDFISEDDDTDLNTLHPQLEDQIEEKDGGDIPALSSLQCVLDPSKFLKNMQKPSLDYSQSEAPGTPLLRHAKLDCVPDTTGLICVSCTAPGEIPLKSVHRLLNEAAEDSSVCTVCWSPSKIDLGDVYKCSKCDVLVHPQCCHDPGVMEDYKWTCAVCLNLKTENGSKRKRTSRPPRWLEESKVSPETDRLLDISQQQEGEVKCALCPFSGGAMSVVERNGAKFWVHEVCRVWTDSEWESDPSKWVASNCALCGRSADRVALVKCAAANCQVIFHPMCALVLTKVLARTQAGQPSTTSQKTTDEGFDLKVSMAEDLKLCSEFTMTILDCEASTPATGQAADETRTLKLPICFCGIHNPKRDRTMYGLYPEGRFITKEIMRVPPLESRMLK